jgi:hypothetical protein
MKDRNHFDIEELGAILWGIAAASTIVMLMQIWYVLIR